MTDITDKVKTLLYVSGTGRNMQLLTADAQELRNQEALYTFLNDECKKELFLGKIESIDLSEGTCGSKMDVLLRGAEGYEKILHGGILTDERSRLYVCGLEKIEPWD